MRETSQTETRGQNVHPSATGNAERQKPFYLPLIGLPAPQFMVDAIQAVRRPIMRDRQRFIHEMPNWVVEQSLKIVGAIYILSEVLMLKAAGIIFLPEGKGRNPVNWVWEPVKNTANAVFERAFGSWAEVKQSAHKLGSWQGIKDSLHGLLDREKAADVELAYRKQHNLPLHKSFINRWQARATLFGFSMMALGFMLPDQRQSPEELEDMGQKAQEKPGAYVAERLKQAVNITEYPQHKRQYVGLGLMLAGICSFLSGFRTPGTNTLTGLPTFERNRAHSIGGLITIAGGTQLMLAVDDEAGWSRYGATMMTRLATVYGSIKGRFETGNKDRYWYSGATAGFQGVSFLSFMLGGAHKKADAAKAEKQGKEQGLMENARSIVKDSSHSAEGVPVYAIEHRGMLEAAAGREMVS